MKEKNNFIEIGSGEDNSIDWDPRFKTLRDIDLILNDYESVDKNIKNNEVVRILDELRNLEASVPNAENFNRALDLIEGCVWVDQEFFDPDMPTSSQWMKINVDESQIPVLTKLINHAGKLFREVYEQDGIPHLITELTESAELKKRKKETETAEKKEEEFKSQVAEFLSEINKVFEQKSGLHHLHPYLINLDDGIVLVLTVHTSYRKIRSDLEQAVTSVLNEKVNIFEIEESSPPGSGYIPYFAGKQRLKEMGWEQNKSVLLHPDEKILKIANDMRDKYVVSILGR